MLLQLIALAGFSQDFRPSEEKKYQSLTGDV